jgi:hypothetical protein
MASNRITRREFVGSVAGAGALAALGIKQAAAQAEPAGTIAAE